MSSKATHILVLDDELSIRESLSDFLEDFDFIVQSADNAENALELLESRPADVAIVDMRLPGMDGNSFIVQANRICPAMRFIIHTGSVNYHMTPDVQQIGVSEQDVFLKPIGNLTVFVDAIHRLTQTKTD